MNIPRCVLLGLKQLHGAGAQCCTRFEGGHITDVQGDRFVGQIYTQQSDDREPDDERKET